MPFYEQRVEVRHPNFPPAEYVLSAIATTQIRANKLIMDTAGEMFRESTGEYPKEMTGYAIEPE